LSKLAALLVNPGASLPTHQVFAGFRLDDRSAPAIDSIPADVATLIPWLTTQSNDLTRAAVSCVPAIADMLSVLAALPGCRVARMSGSGPTCFGLFDDEVAASAAAEQLAKAHGNWWICPSTIG
jgi:4-diphosphocytidyl-2-C-methyl-D-erythritol kinase